MPVAARKTAVIIESDLADMIRAAIEHNAVVVERLAQDPENRNALAAVHMSNTRLGDIWRSIGDYQATVAALELTLEKGRDIGADEAREARKRLRAVR